MDTNSPFEGQPAYITKSSNKKRLVTIFFVVLLLIVAALGALYMLGSTTKHTMQNPMNPVPTETITTAPTSIASSSAQPTSSPSATVSPTTAAASSVSLSISILNGSGIPGAAGKVASALKTAGFTNVTTGNANAYTYTGITVYAKNKTDLQQVQKTITAASTSMKVTASVDNTIPTDVEVIVGK